jgi:hypothetical protein
VKKCGFPELHESSFLLRFSPFKTNNAKGHARRAAALVLLFESQFNSYLNQPYDQSG